MKAKRIICTDISKLEGLGFVYSPAYCHAQAFWKKENVTVKPTSKIVCLTNVSIRNLEVFAEMLNAGIIEFIECERTHNVKMTEEEYREYLKKKE